MNKITVNSIVAELLDNNEYTGRIDIGRLKKWAHTQSEKLSFPEQMVQKIKLLNIDDFRCEKPVDINLITQVAFKEFGTNPIKREQVVEYTQQLFDGSGCELTIGMDCPSCHTSTCNHNEQEVIIDVDELVRRAHPEWEYQHMAHFYKVGGLGKGGYTSCYHPEFQVIGLMDDSSFAGANRHIKGCLNLRKELNCSTCTKYQLEENTIYVNKQKGQLLISYLAIDVDEEGYRKIPDVSEVVDAIVFFLQEKMAWLEYVKTGDQNQYRIYQESLRRKLESMAIAREKLNTQDFPSFIRDLNKFWGKFLPQADSCGNVTDAYDSIMSRITQFN